MTIWFVTRHPGAIEWAARHGVQFELHASHLDASQVGAGDKVIGSLPVHLAADICMNGAEYWNLSLDLNLIDRGRELTADELTLGNARLERYEIRKYESAP